MLTIFFFFVFLVQSEKLPNVFSILINSFNFNFISLSSTTGITFTIFGFSR